MTTILMNQENYFSTLVVELKSSFNIYHENSHSSIQMKGPPLDMMRSVVYFHRVFDNYFP